MMTGPSWFPPIASVEQDLSPGCWCISTPTVDPAATVQSEAAGVFPLPLQAMVLAVLPKVRLLADGQTEQLHRRSPVGLLLGGRRAQELVEVEESVQKYWKVACALAEAIKLARAAAVESFILLFRGEQGAEVRN